MESADIRIINSIFQRINYVTKDGYVSYDHAPNSNTAEHHFKQWKRLSQRTPHPLEEGYGRLLESKERSAQIYKTINAELLMCLISDNEYLRRFAELIGEDLEKS